MQTPSKQQTVLIVADASGLGKAGQEASRLKRDGFHVVALLSDKGAEKQVGADEVLTGDPQTLLKNYIDACEKSTHTTYPERIYLCTERKLAGAIGSLLSGYPVKVIA